MPKFKKADRVEFDYKGETLNGVVRKGGATPKVVIDGGKREFGVPEGLLRISDHPLPKDDPHPMDAWDVKKYAEVSRMSEETTAFTAIVTYDGQEVLHAKNDGRGGCNSYYPIKGGYATTQKFEAEAKKWLMDHGMPERNCFESSDTWLIWKATQAPYGVTAKDFVAQWMEAMPSPGGNSPDSGDEPSLTPGI